MIRAARMKKELEMLQKVTKFEEDFSCVIHNFCCSLRQELLVGRRTGEIGSIA